MNETLPPVGSRIPLLFTYRDTLFGNGFIVEVQATNGRALCVWEGDAVWMYGVNPGGVAAFGAAPTEAHAAFRKTFSNVLVDLALEAHGFEEFKASVETFFAETNAGYESDWQAAVAEVRKKQIQAIGIPAVNADSPRSLTVEIKKAVSAADNRADFEPQLAA